MKTRIISGAVIVAVVALVVFLGGIYPPVVIGFIAAVTAVASFEILNNTGAVKLKAALVSAIVYSVLCVLAYGKILKIKPSLLTLFYVLAIVVISLMKHNEFGLEKIAVSIGMPVILSYAFSSVFLLYLHNNGLYYLLLLLNFSSVCDCGAYFTGVLLGKHKLCPGISPKKTVEGAIGGIVWSMVVSVILYYVFSAKTNLAVLLLLTVPFCVIGMCGDLFASVIKRSVGIKDYGNLIPGHGGILDRFDSVLLIAPVLVAAVSGGII